MNILVTVGTTEFSELIENVDLQLGIFKKYNIEAQIGNSKYVPKNIEYYKYCDNLAQRIDFADIVITHGGAGTVYDLLEKQKKAIVIPNPNVRANHQIEIAQFVNQNNFALGHFTYTNLLEALIECENMEFNRYLNSSDELIKSVADIINKE